MRALGIDHVVIVSPDPERLLGWYTEVLGLEPVRADEWRRGEVPFVSLRVSPGTLIDLMAGERDGTNVDHVAIVVEDIDLDDAVAAGAFAAVELPPMDLYGARGVGRGVYLRDPDGNRVELRTYPP